MRRALRAVVASAAIAASGCASNSRSGERTPAGLAPDVVAFVRDGAPLPAADGRPLAWIRTEDASGAPAAELLDAQRDLPIELVDVPVDVASVERIGRARAATLPVLPAGFAEAHRDSGLLAGECVAWRTGTVWIAVPDDSPMSELRVWFVLRALTLLRHRYADAWSALFEPPGRTPLLVAFDDYPTAIAASFTARGGPGSPGVPVVLVHPGHAGGEDPECGSAAIYRSGDSATDFLRYMSDGLVETLVHEMLHVYVEAASASDPACRFLSTSPARAEGARDAWIATEECVIANTSLGYFARAGGLSKDVRSYYAHLTSRWIEYARTSPATLDESIADVMSLGVSGRIPRDGDFVRTLRLRVLDPPPGATTR